MNPNWKTGKHPKKVDLRTVQLADFIDKKTLPPVPKKLVEMNAITEWPMFKNDSVGDCVLAAAAHVIELITKLGQGIEASITDDDVIKAYSDITGYNPNDPSTDQGTNMLDALNYWRKTGIGGHRIAGFAEFNPKDHDQWRVACDLFGNAYVGVSLPISAQAQSSPHSSWKVTYGHDSLAGGWGGHGICFTDYDYYSAKCVTWGYVQRATWGWLNKYADEAYVVFDQDWVSTVTNKSPQGFDVTGLQNVLAQFHRG